MKIKNNKTLFTLLSLSVAFICLIAYINKIVEERETKNTLYVYNFLETESVFKNSKETTFYLFELDNRKDYNNSRNLNISYKYGNIFDGTKRKIEYKVTLLEFEKNEIWTQHLNDFKIPNSFKNQLWTLAQKSNTFKIILNEYPKNITFKDVVEIKQKLKKYL